MTVVTRPYSPLPVKRNQRKKAVGARAAWAASVVVLSLGALLVLAPFIFMVSTSLNAAARTSVPFPPQIIPSEPTLSQYKLVIQSIHFGRLYLNTAIVEIVEIAFSMSSALLAGYSLSKMRPRGGGIVLFLTLATLMIPAETTIIPNFLTFNKLGLLDTYWPIWLPAISYPFGTFLIKQYLDSLPSELRDSARVDGANEFNILRLIYLPLCKGILAVCAILLFLSVWNNYLWPLIVINDPNKFTVQLGIASFNQTISGQQYALPGVNMAATVLSIAPVLAVYLFFQRYIVESVASTGIKG